MMIIILGIKEFLKCIITFKLKEASCFIVGHKYKTEIACFGAESTLEYYVCERCGYTW